MSIAKASHLLLEIWLDYDFVVSRFIHEYSLYQLCGYNKEEETALKAFVGKMSIQFIVILELFVSSFYYFLETIKLNWTFALLPFIK